jgi:hypothetical protein
MLTPTVLGAIWEHLLARCIPFENRIRLVGFLFGGADLEFPHASSAPISAKAAAAGET